MNKVDMMMSLWGGREYHQDRRISEARSAASKSANQAQRARQELRAVEHRLDKLTMISMAMWSLVQDQTNLTDDDLIKRVEEIDLQDGKLDGKVAPAPATCDQCGRNFHPKRRACLYCGADRSMDTAFDQVL